jgi:hypothetical protein
VKTPIRRPALDCPSAETLLACHRGRLSPRKKGRVSAHLSRCPECGRRNGYILSVIGDEERLLREIEALLPENKRRLPVSAKESPDDGGLWVFRAVETAAALVVFLVLTLAPPGGGLPGRRSLASSGFPDRPRGLSILPPGLLPGLTVIEPRYDIPEMEEVSAGRYRTGDVAGSFRLRARSEIIGSRLGESGYYGWSLSVAAAASISRPESLEGKNGSRLRD